MTIVDGVTEPPKPIPPKEPGKERRVFGQDVSCSSDSFFMFNSYEDVGSYNPENPGACQYSILDQLEKYKDSKKGFRLKLCYVEIEPPVGFEESCNEWYQQSHPYYESDITGYEPISIPFPKISDTETFKGLGKKVDPIIAAIDALPNESERFQFVVGLISLVNYDTAIPGPPNMGTHTSSQYGKSVKNVELYVIDPME